MRTNSLATPLLAAVAIVLAACGGTTTPPSPAATQPAASPTTAATVAPTSSPSPTAPPVPAGSLAWPTAFAAPMQVARYFSSPPFEVPFTVEIDQPGWIAGHTHPTFTDIQWYEDGTVEGLPARMIGWSHPEHVRGPDGNVPVAGLTPDAAIDLLLERASLRGANREAVELFGLEGALVDLHSDVGNNPTFGDPTGDFGLGPELDARIAVLPFEGGFLLALVLAETDDLEAAWEDALPMLESVDLTP